MMTEGLKEICEHPFCGGEDVSQKDWQEVVDLFISALDLCSALRSKLYRLEEENKCLENNYIVLNQDRNRLQAKKGRAEELIAVMKKDLLLAASGHCCWICSRRDRCADTGQVACCSAFRYYKEEE